VDLSDPSPIFKNKKPKELSKKENDSF